MTDTLVPELEWRCLFHVEACNPLTKDKFSLEHKGCHWVPAQVVGHVGSFVQGPENFVEESSPPEPSWGQSDERPQGPARRAPNKGKMGDTFGCRCGATLSIAEIHVAGAIIGALDLARVAFRRLHAEPGCTEWKPWEGF